MNKLIGLLFLVGWVGGQLLRLTGEFPVTIMDVAVGLMIIAEIRGIRGIREIMWITLILGISWVLGFRIFFWQQLISGGFYLLRFLGYLWVIANAGKLLLPIKKFITPAFWVFVILAWIQYLLIPDTRFLLRYGWDEHYYRMIGTVLDPNYLGVMLGIIGIYLIYKYTNRQIDKWGKILLMLSFGGLIMTYSRAAWLATGAGLSLFVIARSLRRGNLRQKIDRHGLWKGLVMTFEIGSLKILIGLLFFGLVLYLSPKPGGEGVNLFRTASIEQRIESWKEGINVWKEHLWLGVGFNNYGGKVQESTGKYNKVQESRDHSGNAPSSSWVLLLATTGIIGTGWLTMVGWLAVRNLNRPWVGILMMVGVHAVFNNTMFYPPVLGLLALVRVASED